MFLFQEKTSLHNSFEMQNESYEMSRLVFSEKYKKKQMIHKKM